VNNYGVWVDEFRALGMGDTIEREFTETLCYFQEMKEVRGAPCYVGREKRTLSQTQGLPGCCSGQ
jgi:hypothetical protein